MEEKRNYGGRRIGAGRPPKNKIRMNFMISIELAEKLKNIDNKSEFVNNAVKLAFEKFVDIK